VGLLDGATNTRSRGHVASACHGQEKLLGSHHELVGTAPGPWEPIILPSGPPSKSLGRWCLLGLNVKRYIERQVTVSKADGIGDCASISLLAALVQLSSGE
jgi:hypothetical protein